MIKFFRNIRKKLLTEGKTANYFKYAIGEIVLVVIGILIALQINNWNESRKDIAIKNSYKESLIEDLIKDSIRINESIHSIKADSTALDNFEKRVSSSIAPLDTILKIARYEYIYLIEIHPDYNDDTFKTLISTGNINLFKREIIEEINALYNIQERALLAHVQSWETYRRNLSLYAQKYPIPFQSNLINNGTKAADIIWGEISLTEHATEFNALVLSKGDSYRLSLGYLPYLLDKTNSLLAKLSKQ